MNVVEEEFWLKDAFSLFRTMNFIPYGDITSGTRLNAITRLILVIYVIMLYCKFKYATQFLIISLIFIVVLYFCYKRNTIRTKENFEISYINNNNMNSNNMNMNENIPDQIKSNYNSYSKKTYNMFNDPYKADPIENHNTLNPNITFPATKVVENVGIQYYTPNVGTNKSMFIEPIIAPRSLDKDVWASPSTYPQGMNTETMYNLTESNNFPNGRNSYAQDIDLPYTRDNFSIYEDAGVWGEPQGVNPMLWQPTTKAPATKPPQTKFQEINNLNIDSKYVNPEMNKTPISQITNQNYQGFNYDKTLENTYGGKEKVTSIGSVMDSKGPVGNYMIEPSPTYMYKDDYFNQPTNALFLQDIQPNVYSYSLDPTPINSNIGISYSPQDPPRFLDQVYTDNRGYPVYTQIDPQLVRDIGLTPGQRANQPQRNGISAKYTNWEAPPGSVNFEDIYDPRFTSYGDPYRSYSDVNLGQVQYYYSDVDAYKRPNFIIRSNVDFVDYHDPMGKTKPYYDRTASLADVKDSVENRFDADALFFREDLMASQMAKRNSEMWQLREAPLKKGNYGSGISWGPSV